MKRPRYPCRSVWSIFQLSPCTRRPSLLVISSTNLSIFPGLFGKYFQLQQAPLHHLIPSRQFEQNLHQFQWCSLPLTLPPLLLQVLPHVSPPTELKMCSKTCDQCRSSSSCCLRVKIKMPQGYCTLSFFVYCHLVPNWRTRWLVCASAAPYR